MVMHAAYLEAGALTGELRVRLQVPNMATNAELDVCSCVFEVLCGDA